MSSEQRTKTGGGGDDYPFCIQIIINLSILSLQVLQIMESRGIQPNDRTKIFQMKLYGMRNDPHRLLRVIDEEPDDTINKYFFSTVISSLPPSLNQSFPATVIKLLRRAVKLRLADEAIFTSAAQKLSLENHNIVALKIIDSMLVNNFKWNKLSLSVAITTCLRLIRYSNTTDQLSSSDLRNAALDSLSKYLSSVKALNPELLTNELSQNVISKLCNLKEILFVCQLLLGSLSECMVKAETLTEIFTELQNLCEISFNNGNLQLSEGYALKGLALIGLYSSRVHRYALQTLHFNSVLRMLSITKMFNLSEQLFKFMSHDVNVKDMDGKIVSSSVSNDHRTTLRKPTTFTIAELIRAARECHRPDLAHEVMMWSAKYEDLYVPVAVIRDAVSYVYGEGMIDLAASMYRALYVAGKVQHWRLCQDGILADIPSSRSEWDVDDISDLVMDLHNFSRGMAYAAVVCALDEVCSNRAIIRFRIS